MRRAPEEEEEEKKAPSLFDRNKLTLLGSNQSMAILAGIQTKFLENKLNYCRLKEISQPSVSQQEVTLWM